MIKAVNVHAERADGFPNGKGGKRCMSGKGPREGSLQRTEKILPVLGGGKGRVARQDATSPPRKKPFLSLKGARPAGRENKTEKKAFLPGGEKTVILLLEGKIYFVTE